LKRGCPTSLEQTTESDKSKTGITNSNKNI